MTAQQAVVVGSGFGGLAAAVRLRAMGWPVRLIEANPTLGGRAAPRSNGPFSFDAGPTVITAPYLFDELFQSVGRDPKDYFELLPVDPFYRVRWDDGTSFDYVGDEHRLLENIKAFSPGDVQGYLKLADLTRRIFEIGYTELADVPFDRVSEMLRAVPDMLRLGSYRSVYSMVAAHIRDERLRQVFTFQPLLIGGNPFRASSIYLLIHWLERKWGVWYPRGGVGSLVDALETLLGEIGVDIVKDAPVEHLEVSNGAVSAVHTADGMRHPCSVVVANADPSVVYPQWIDEKHRRVRSNRSVRRVRSSMSLVVVYIAARGRWEGLAHHTIQMGPRYRELIRDIFDRKVLADDFSLYVHAPDQTDTQRSPDGYQTFYALSPVPNLLGDTRWEAMAEAYADRIVDALDRTTLPGIKDRIEVREIIDPRHFATQLRSRDGAAFGPEPTLTQSAWFRYHNRSQDVGGLFFVGAGTHPGAGVPGVLTSAKVLDRVVPAPDKPMRVVA